MIATKKKIIICVLIFACTAFILSKTNCFFAKHSCKHFQQFEHYRELQNVFDGCDKQTLITFDVDDTLITAKDVMANFEIPFWFKIRMAFKYPTLLSHARQDWFASIIVQQAEFFVFDPDVVIYIQQLRRRGCPVLALTSMDSGEYGVVKSMPEWRANMLYSFGIDLNVQFQDTLFKNLFEYRGDYPCLYKGILCANQQPKGLVLGAFLDYSHLKPARIISFDDDACALDSIARECQKRSIAFTGYQCLGAKKFAGEWNNRRALLQLDYVMQHAKWLSDKEADTMFARKIAVS